MLEVGRVVKPHGLRGEVIVDMVSNRPARRLVAGTVLSSDRGALEVAAARPHQGRWIVSFVGAVGREGAEALRGAVLSAEALEEEGALWVHELIGAEVVDVGGRSWGQVSSVEANPASDLLVVGEGRLVPLTFVVGRDQGGRLVIDPPAGLDEL